MTSASRAVQVPAALAIPVTGLGSGWAFTDRTHAKQRHVCATRGTSTGAQDGIQPPWWRKTRGNKLRIPSLKNWPGRTLLSRLTASLLPFQLGIGRVAAESLLSPARTATAVVRRRAARQSRRKPSSYPGN